MNYVYIETSKHTGSGVILKCEYERAGNRALAENPDGCEAYIVLTNYHVLCDLEQNQKDQKKYVDLEIFDVNGEIIDQQFIEAIYFASGNNYDCTSDAAALLVLVNQMCKVACDNDVYFDYAKDIIVTTIGYPHVFQDDVINRHLNLEGKLEDCGHNNIGIYKIQDDYHWYQNVTDKDLLEGLSGGPVYAKYNHKEILIGINQSICNIGGGRNPFKIVYFLPIRKVLEWLRSQGIIIFEYVNYNVRIKWIMGIWRKETERTKKTIMLIGNSGSGKTSFVKSFCLNGNQIDASGDGQTTRMSIRYQIETFCEEPKIEIKFRKKTDFVDYLMQKIQYSIINFICHNRFGMKLRDIESDRMVYLRDFILPIEYLEDTVVKKEGGIDVSNQIKQTLYLNSCEKDDISYDDRILKCYDSIFQLLERILKQKSDYDFLYRMQKILNIDLFEKYKGKCNQTMVDDKQLIHRYFTDVIELDKKIVSNINENRDLVREFKKLINECSGYFDIEEFKFLYQEGEWEKVYEKHFKKLFLIATKGDENNDDTISNANWIALECFRKRKERNEEIESEDNYTLYGMIEKYYEEIYDSVIDRLEERGFVQENKKEICFYFDELSKCDRELITRSLRVEHGNSLTSLIESITIEDSFSNDFAMLLDEKNMEEITFIDTCGLDHVERGNQIEVYLTNMYNEIVEQNNRGVDAFFYVKKMDSTKPVELEKMLPILNRLFPATPIYCIFTAADLFFAGKETYLSKLRWDRQTYKSMEGVQELLFPKVVAHLLKSNDIVHMMRGPKSVREKMYAVITDNLVPFTSQYGINDHKWLELNKRSIDIVLTSMLIEEWLGDFIKLGVCGEKDYGHSTELKEAIGKDMKKMFLVASDCRWKYKHHMTTRANFRRLFRHNMEYDKLNPTLGYNGVEIGRWDNLLQRGYAEAFLGENGETLKVMVSDGLGEQKAYAILVAVKDRMLLRGMSVWDWDKKAGYFQEDYSVDSKQEFRGIFEEMYRQEAYKNNPFERKSKAEFDEYRICHDKRIEYLEDVCDFRKGLNNNEILDKFVEYVYDEIFAIIRDENKRCINLLLKYKKDFSSNLNSVLKIMCNYTADESSWEKAELLKVIMDSV